MSEEAQRNVNKVEWLWLAMLLGNVVAALLVMWIGPTNLDEAYQRYATMALVVGGALALPTLFVYQKWNQFRYRTPRPDPESDDDLQAAQVWMTTGALASSLPMYVGIGFYMFTGNSSVLMVLTGISLGILMNFRPATLFGTA
ncbi:MAG: hypothetical protein ING77_16420 [Rhodocyclaceae bacterium]|nr:hypothetical protein [Rhodocyclaceae bacterium]MCA3076646.1 hypothetical protein [Rhodocyclaceae bacterium]MCA3091433.1 hypothetical protein [Rhodocyclaceae bacterium]MCA3094242.1 hypothetical protein [Rhodocyclaceae bacterium]MCA3098416.1 hypothetical protein [Rhodocyclaceae bacterium]